MTDDTFDFTGCSLSEPYALQVLGNEMEPEFPDQCIVVIRPEDSCTAVSYTHLTLPTNREV